MTDYPVAYLRNAHARAEKLARAATPGPWTAHRQTWVDSFEADIGRQEQDDVVGHGYEGGGVVEWDDAMFIAANAPDKVLTRIEAERAIFVEHEPTWASGEPEYEHHHETVIGEHGRTRYIEVRNDGPIPPYWCACCSTEAPCRTLLALAAGWGWTEEGS